MKLSSLLHKLTLTLLLAATWVFTSCDSFYEDLPECRLYVNFKYDYNILSVDGFHTQVDKVVLYVFDKEGNFLFTQSEEGAPLSTGNFRMEVSIPNGEYKFMAWAGARDSYEIVSLTPGQSTIEELQLKLKRDASLIINNELEPLWHGEIRHINFTGKINHTETINMIKNTNKVKFLFMRYDIVDGDAWIMSPDDYTFEIIEANGWLRHDNSLIEDDILSYQPYMVEQATNEGVVVELNTMRLMEDREARFVVTEKTTGRSMFNINLTYYLAKSRISGKESWGDQEYLDRQDEYIVTFFYSESFLNVKIQINDWTYYFQDNNL